MKLTEDFIDQISTANASTSQQKKPLSCETSPYSYSELKQLKLKKSTSLATKKSPKESRSPSIEEAIGGCHEVGNHADEYSDYGSLNET